MQHVQCPRRAGPGGGMPARTWRPGGAAAAAAARYGPGPSAPRGLDRAPEPAPAPVPRPQHRPRLGLGLHRAGVETLGPAPMESGAGRGRQTQDSSLCGKLDPAEWDGCTGALPGEPLKEKSPELFRQPQDGFGTCEAAASPPYSEVQTGFSCRSLGPSFICWAGQTGKVYGQGRVERCPGGREFACRMKAV